MPILPYNIAHFFAPNSLVVSQNPDLSLQHFFFVCFMSREWCRILVSGLLLRAEIKIDLISIKLDTISSCPSSPPRYPTFVVQLLISSVATAAILSRLNLPPSLFLVCRPFFSSFFVPPPLLYTALFVIARFSCLFFLLPAPTTLVICDRILQKLAKVGLEDVGR